MAHLDTGLCGESKAYFWRPRARRTKGLPLSPLLRVICMREDPHSYSREGRLEKGDIVVIPFFLVSSGRYKM